MPVPALWSLTRFSPSHVAVALAASLAVGALGCRVRRDAHNAPGKYAPGASAECANGYTTADGPYRYENNQWGSGKSQGAFE